MNIINKQIYENQPTSITVKEQSTTINKQSQKKQPTSSRIKKLNHNYLKSHKINQNQINISETI